MFKRIVSAAVLSAALFGSIAPAEAQVDYWSHGYTPYAAGNSYYDSHATVNIRSGYLNGRQGAGTNHRIIAAFYAGESVEITRVYYNRADGQPWYLVTSYNTEAQGWVRGDYIRR